MITVKNLHKWYEKKHVLKGLNLRVGDGEIFGLLGPNGAGKTTLIKILTGQTSGQGYVRVAGVNPLKAPVEVRKISGIVPENESVPNYLTVEEYLYFIANLRKLDRSSVKSTIRKFELEEYRDVVCKDLSKGTKQRLMIATAFIHKPKILFLDEPFINLDPIYQRKMRDIIEEYAHRGKTVFMATHIIEVAEKMCTKIGIIKDGKIVKIAERGEDVEELFLREFEND